MTIASAIATKQQQVADSYTAVSNKGGTLPTTQNLTNLATAIQSIPSGSSADVEEALHRINSGDIIRVLSFSFDVSAVGEEPDVLDTTYQIFLDDLQIYSGIPKNHEKFYYTVEFGKSYVLKFKAPDTSTPLAHEIYMNDTQIGDLIEMGGEVTYNFTVNNDASFSLQGFTA